jgi:hypothetical protein
MPHNQDPIAHSRSWRDAKKVITPFCPPNIKKRGRKARKSPGIKINNSRVRNPVQKVLITSTTKNNLLWFNQIREVKANQQLAKPS